MDLHARLKERGLTLPPAPKPVATYVPAVIADTCIMVSGQLPTREGQLIATGPVASAVALEKAQEAARQCVLNGLAVIDATLEGDWSRFVRIVRVGAFVASDSDFYDQPKVANGASELLGELLGDAGRHARAAVGVNVLPLNATVEVELMAQIKPAS